MNRFVDMLVGRRSNWRVMITDFYAWCDWPGAVRPKTLLTFIRFFRWPEYRVVLGARLKQCGLLGKLLSVLVRLRTRHLNLYIRMKSDKIGGGFKVQHGYATGINAKQIGENCCVGQKVTIGWSHSGLPTLGNNIVVFVGAIIVGGITIGDNCVIGAGAVVTKDIPAGSTVVGTNRILKREEQ